jgi:hypothetical protein
MFGIIGVEPSGSATTVLVTEIGCEYGRWMKLAQDRVHWRALLLAVLNLRVMISEWWLVKETGCDDGRWMEMAQDHVYL